MDWLKTCRKIGENASREVGHYFKKPQAAEKLGRGYGGDITTRIDKVVEDDAISELKKVDAPLKIISEECGILETGEKPEHLILIDPLDGSFNFHSGIGYFSTSIAVFNAETEEQEFGYVKNLSSKSEYWATQENAFKNGNRLSESEDKELKSVLFECSPGASESSIKKLAEAFRSVRHGRAFGSIAIDFCKIASGDFDLLLDAGASRFLDVAAGCFIVKKSGGWVSDFEGNSAIEGASLVGKDILAAGNKKIAEKFIGKKL